MEASQGSSSYIASSPAPERPGASIGDGLTLILSVSGDTATSQAAVAAALAAARRLTQNYELLLVSDQPPPCHGGGRWTGATEDDPRVRWMPWDAHGASGWHDVLAMARYEWIAVARADGRYRLEELDRLAAFAEDFDAVSGYRVSRSPRRLPALLQRCSGAAANLLLGTDARDPGCEIKLFRRSCLPSPMEFTADPFSHVELLARLSMAGARHVEVGVCYDPQGAESSPDRSPSPPAVGKAKTSPPHWPAVRLIAGQAAWMARLIRFWWSQTLFAHDEATVAASDPGERGWQGRQAAIAWGVLILATVVFFCSNLSYALLEPDESRNARIAHEMVRTGDYVVPYRFGEPYLDKPPLLYWLTAASYRLFGVSDGAARVGCALAGMITVLMCYGLGRRLAGQRAAWFGAFSLMLCTGFAIGGKFLIMDGLLTCFVTLAMISGYLAIHGQRVRAGWCVAASVFCGLGVMTKGPLAVVLFLPPLMASRWLTGAGARLTWRHWLLCLAPGALIALPWFVMVTFREPQFLEYFFWRHHIERFATDFNHDQPWWYYIPVLLLGMFPASLLLGPLLVFLFGRDRRFRVERTREMGYLLLCAGWVLLFFSMSRGKLPPYIIPALPPLCLLAGKFLDAMIAGRPASDCFPRLRLFLPELICVTALAGLAIVGIIDLALGGGRNYGFLIDGLLILVGGGLFFYLPHSRFKPLIQQWATAGALTWAAMAYAFLNFYPDVAYSRSIAMQAQELCVAYGDPQMPIVLFGRREESLFFYLPHDRVREFHGKQEQQVAEYLRRFPQAILVSDRDDIASLRAVLTDSLEIDEVGGRGHIFLSATQPTNVARECNGKSR